MNSLSAPRAYAKARAQFAGICSDLGWSVQRIVHPERGPEDEPLSCDTCWVGPRDAPAVLILISGTHGVEGLAGSACQISWLRQRPQLPRGVAVLVVHMLNPHGCAWSRRQTEDNVDLNRNFLDFDAALPENPLYARIHPYLLCPELQGPLRDVVSHELDKVRVMVGSSAYTDALTRGQYTFPDGVGFGGRRATWSRSILEGLLRDQLAHARQVAAIDIHTGLGRFGCGMLIVGDQGPAARRAEAWLEETVVAVRGPDAGLPYQVHGDLLGGLQTILPSVTLTSVALEFGTHDLEQMLCLFIADCWLHNFGDPHAASGRQVRDAMQDFFFPRDPFWLSATTRRAHAVIWRIVHGLAAAEN